MLANLTTYPWKWIVELSEPANHSALIEAILVEISSIWVGA